MRRVSSSMLEGGKEGRASRLLRAVEPNSSHLKNKVQDEHGEFVAVCGSVTAN